MIVNGKEIPLTEETTLEKYLESVGCDVNTIAVGLNGTVIPRTAFAGTQLQDGDTIEIVRIVGGG